MDLTIPMQSVIPSAHGAVLNVLARTDEPLSGRRVAELTRPKFGQRQVNDVLQQLAHDGIVRRESRPPSNLYRLNHDHVAAEGILALANMWTVLLARMRAELDSWSIQPDLAWLFGSAARGEAGSDSDIDIVVIRPVEVSLTDASVTEWQRQTDDLTQQVTAWTGNACELLDMDSAEFDAAVERNDRLVSDLRRHAVPLGGGRDARAALRRKTRR